MFTSTTGDRVDAPNIVIAFTDGNSNVNADSTLPMAVQARIKGIHIITVGIGNSRCVVMYVEVYNVTYRYV